jgi:hypothetical protein
VSSWSLLQRSPTECGVSECDRESSIMWRSSPTGGAVASLYKKTHKISYTNRQVVPCYSTCLYVILKLEHGVLYMQRSGAFSDTTNKENALWRKFWRNFFKCWEERRNLPPKGGKCPLYVEVLVEWVINLWFFCSSISFDATWLIHVMTFQRRRLQKNYLEKNFRFHYTHLVSSMFESCRRSYQTLVLIERSSKSWTSVETSWVNVNCQGAPFGATEYVLGAKVKSGLFHKIRFISMDINM